jgi:hypothetical protein
MAAHESLARHAHLHISAMAAGCCRQLPAAARRATAVRAGSRLSISTTLRLAMLGGSWSGAEVAAPQGERHDFGASSVPLARISASTGALASSLLATRKLVSLAWKLSRGAAPADRDRPTRQSARSAVTGGKTGQLQPLCAVSSMAGRAAPSVILVEIAGIGDRDLAADVGRAGLPATASATR